MEALEMQIGGGHYKDMPMQPIEFLQAAGLPFTLSNCVKYLARWKSKNGVEDLRKVVHYLALHEEVPPARRLGAVERSRLRKLTMKFLLANNRHFSPMDAAAITGTVAIVTHGERVGQVRDFVQIMIQREAAK